MLDVIIIGAGLAGLAAAKVLKKASPELALKVIEADSRIGGREKTDEVDGFLLDNGFHVFLTAYPEAQAVLDYDSLNLKPFYHGALIRTEQQFQKVADPWRHPLAALSSLVNNVGSLSDKLKVKSLRDELLSLSDAEIYRQPEMTTQQYLQAYGFSDGFIDKFFRPFFGGIFLESELQTSNRFFKFVFRSFSAGEAALPAQGIQAIPKQLAECLSSEELLLNAKVSKLAPGRVELDNGENFEAKVIIVATNAHNNAQLTQQQSPEFNGTQCVYFACDKAPIDEPILVLNGEGQGLINNLCVPNLVAPTYASKGGNLLSVSIVGSVYPEATLANTICEELRGWFGKQVNNWKYLKTYTLPHSLPVFHSPANLPSLGLKIIEPGLYCCGDYLETPSINGALASGRKVAEVTLAHLGLTATAVV